LAGNASISRSSCVCSCLWTGNAAAAGGAILYLTFFLPYYFIIPHYDDIEYFWMMIAAAIDLVVAMSFGCVQIAAFEKSGELRRPTGSRLSPRSRYFAPLA